MSSTYLNAAQYTILDKASLVIMDANRATSTAAAFSDLEAIRFMDNGAIAHGVVLKTAVQAVTGKTRGPAKGSTGAPATTPEAKEAM